MLPVCEKNREIIFGSPTHEELHIYRFQPVCLFELKKRHDPFFFVMSLIARPEFRKQISSAAAVCLNCVFPNPSGNKDNVAVPIDAQPQTSREVEKGQRIYD
jgi:hypothetical protein